MQQLYLDNAEPAFRRVAGARVLCAQPIENIYKFEGVFMHADIKESLSLENSLWANTVLASGKIYGKSGFL